MTAPVIQKVQPFMAPTDATCDMSSYKLCVLASDYERLEQELATRNEQLGKIIDIDLGIYPQSVTGGDNPYTERTGYMDGWNDHSIQHSQAVEAIFKGEEPESTASKQLAACMDELDNMKRSWGLLHAERNKLRAQVESMQAILAEARIMTSVVNSGQSGVLRGQIDAVLQAKQEETPNAN